MTEHGLSPSPTPSLQDLDELVKWAETRRASLYAAMGTAGPHLSTHDKEEVFQDALVDLVKAAAQRQAIRRWDSWLFTVVRNKAHSRIARSYRRAEREVVGDYNLAQVEDDSGNESRHATQLEVERLQEAIKTLKPTYRQPLEMKVTGMSYAEIAATLDLTEPNARQRVARAKKLVRANMSQRASSPVSTAVNETLEELLIEFIEKGHTSPSRLAADIREQFPEASVSRSSVHRWTTGQSSTINNKLSVLALAAVLNLSHNETDRLLAAAGHPRLERLRATMSSGEEVFLAKWFTT